MRALPMPPRKVTELVPLPAHPAQVKVPEVENVTGSAFASAIPSDTIARSNALMMDALKTPFMVAPFLFRLDVRPHTLSRERRSLLGYGHPVKGRCCHSRGTSAGCDNMSTFANSFAVRLTSSRTACGIQPQLRQDPIPEAAYWLALVLAESPEVSPSYRTELQHY